MYRRMAVVATAMDTRPKPISNAKINLNFDAMEVNYNSRHLPGSSQLPGRCYLTLLTAPSPAPPPPPVRPPLPSSVLKLLSCFLAALTQPLLRSYAAAAQQR